MSGVENWKSEKLNLDRTRQNFRFSLVPDAQSRAGEGVRFRTAAFGQNRRSLATENIKDAGIMVGNYRPETVIHIYEVKM